MSINADPIIYETYRLSPVKELHSCAHNLLQNPKLCPLPPTAEPHGVQLEVAASDSGELNENDIFMGYLSDDESSGSDEDDNNDELMQTNPASGSSGCAADRINHYSRLDMGDLNADEASFRVRVPPQPKRWKLDVPA
jgi:hypothetical protein